MQANCPKGPGQGRGSPPAFPSLAASPVAVGVRLGLLKSLRELNNTVGGGERMGNYEASRPSALLGVNHGLAVGGRGAGLEESSCGKPRHSSV